MRFFVALGNFGNLVAESQNCYPYRLTKQQFSIHLMKIPEFYYDIISRNGVQPFMKWHSNFQFVI